jgi:hypothetical protein
MASLKTLDVPPMDPNNIFSGPTRLLAGPTRMDDVTPGTPYGEFAEWLYVGVTGDVSIIKWDGSTQILKAMAAGIWHRMGSIGVNTSGTTATNLVWGS